MTDLNRILMALRVVAWHATSFRETKLFCDACLATSTKEDNCPVMAVVEATENPFPEEGIDPLPIIRDALATQDVRVFVHEPGCEGPKNCTCKPTEYENAAQDVQAELDMANEALGLAREVLGDEDLPFLDDGIRRLKNERDHLRKQVRLEEHRDKLAIIQTGLKVAEGALRGVLDVLPTSVTGKSALHDVRAGLKAMEEIRGGS